jgi:hypothetical protein
MDRNRWRNLSACIDLANSNCDRCHIAATTKYTMNCKNARQQLDQKLADNLNNCLAYCGTDTTRDYPVKGTIPDCNCQAGYEECVQQMDERYAQQNQQALDEYAQQLDNFRQQLQQDTDTCTKKMEDDVDNCWKAQYEKVIDVETGRPAPGLSPILIISSLIKSRINTQA